MRDKVDASQLDDVFEPFSMTKFKEAYESRAVEDVLAYVASNRLLTRDEPVLDTQLTSAFFLELIRVNQEGVLAPGIRINLPRLPNLEYTFGHLIFQIDYVHLRDGTIISPKNIAELRKRPEPHDGLHPSCPRNIQTQRGPAMCRLTGSVVHVERGTPGSVFPSVSPSETTWRCSRDG